MKLRGGDFSTSHSFLTFEDTVMRLEAIKSYFGPSINPINDPHPSTKATKEFLLKMEKKVSKNKQLFEDKKVFEMFAKDTEYFFKQVISRYESFLWFYLDDKERSEFCDHLDALVAFHKYCEEKSK